MAAEDISARGATYATRSDTDTIENLSKKLTADMRDNIKSLAMHEVLSDSWNATAEKLCRIANISEMEKRIPKKATDATLWEGEELALRYLLEDGKLNLSLRLVEEYTAHLFRCDEAGTRITGESALRCARFEFGAGVMLANAWMHKEAFQTTDIPLMARVFVAVLARAQVNPPLVTNVHVATSDDESDGVVAGTIAAGGAGGGGSAGVTATTSVPVSSLSTPKRALESIALQFLLAAGKHAVGPYERRVVAEFMRSGVFDLAALHLHANHARLDPGDVAAGCEGLALLVATEEFTTAKARAFSREGAALAVASLRGDLLDKLAAAADAATKRKLRPLLDLSAEVGRRVGVK